MALPLDDQLAIHDLYARYCHALDDGDGDGVAACFTADGTLDAKLGDPVVGTEALTAFVAGVVQFVPGIRHQATNVMVTGEGDAATGRAYLYAYRAGANGHEVIITGRYRDTLRKDGGTWRFVLRTMDPDVPAAASA